MKIDLELPEDLPWLREALSQCYESAESEVEAGSRPEFAAGRFSMVKEICSTLESKFTQRALEVEQAFRERPLA